MTAATPIDELSEQIRRSWAELEAVLGRFSDEQTAGLTRDGWTVKDHLAHVAASEQFCLAAFDGTPLHEAVWTDKDTLLRSSDDELNDIVYRRARDLPLAQVRETKRATHERLLGLLATVTADDLRKPFVRYPSDGDGQETGMSMLDILRGNTVEHYEAHRGWLAALAERASLA